MALEVPDGHAVPHLDLALAQSLAHELDGDLDAGGLHGVQHFLLIHYYHYSKSITNSTLHRCRTRAPSLQKLGTVCRQGAFVLGGMVRVTDYFFSSRRLPLQAQQAVVNPLPFPRHLGQTSPSTVSLPEQTRHTTECLLDNAPVPPHFSQARFSTPSTVILPPLSNTAFDTYRSTVWLCCQGKGWLEYLGPQASQRTRAVERALQATCLEDCVGGGGRVVAVGDIFSRSQNSRGTTWQLDTAHNKAIINYSFYYRRQNYLFMLNKTASFNRRSLTPTRSPLKEARVPSTAGRIDREKKAINNRMHRLLQEKEIECEKIHAMREAGTPQKCLLHDVFLSSFCRNCRRIICVNCVYGHNEHKTHNVIPIKNSEHDIVLCNENMHNKIRKTIETLSSTLLLCQSNFNVLQKNLTRSISDLKASFETIYLTLRDKQLECEKELVRTFSMAKDCNELLQENAAVLQKFVTQQMRKVEGGGRKLPDQLIYVNKLYSTLSNDMPSDFSLSPEKEQARPVISEVQIKQINAKIKALKLSPVIMQRDMFSKTRNKVSLSELIRSEST